MMVWKVVKESMPISTATNSDKLSKNQKGFSIVEIMVALMLVAAIMILVPFSKEDSDRQMLEDSVNLINRTIRFSVNESILRNVLVRIKFDLETSPVEYSIEYGNGPEVILPKAVDTSRLSISEREAQEKQTEKFDNQFTPISEFTDGPQTLPEGVEMYAIGTSYNPILVTGGEASIFFYPTGEKDSSFLIMNNEIGMATLSVAPFEDRTYHEFIRFNEEQIDRFDETIEDKSKEEFDKWLKD